MTPERWQEVKELFAEVLEQKPADRANYLESVCVDSSLRREVELMIFAHVQEGSDFMERPAMEGNEVLKGGTKLGPYEIVSRIGSGGMGEVYRARDTRLNRTVAIKTLAPHLVDSAASSDRFEREARLIASLNHPHICTLHDVGHQDGTNYLIMEYLDGETLASRLVRGKLPLDQMLMYAIQIADALDKAHRRGVTHRDLKPGNVMLTKSGAKLLDFGLAKLKQRASSAGGSLSQLPTEKDSVTAQGTIVGTLQYMAPEQLQGKAMDARADIFSFGAVLYEMATGKRAFEGESAASTIAKILETEPQAITSLEPMVPAALDRLVRRCLVKDPEERLQSAQDLKFELEWIRDAASESKSVPAASKSWLRRALTWTIACGAIAVVIAVGFSFIRKYETNSAARDAMRFEIPVPAGATLSLIKTFAVSPDGRQLAFAAKGSDGVLRLWIRRLDSLEARPLPESASTVNDPFFWSSDSKFIAYMEADKLKKIDVASGSAQTICNLDGDVGGGGSWNRDDVIIFTGKQGLMRVSAEGGTATVLIPRASGNFSAVFPWFLPDGNHFLYLGYSPKSAERGVYVGSLDGQQGPGAKLLLATEQMPVYVPLVDPNHGELFFLRDGNLLAQPFDTKRFELTADAVTVAEHIGFISNYGLFSASINGVLIYRTDSPIGGTQLQWFDRQGKPLNRVGEPGFYLQFALSPDNAHVGIHSVDPQHPASIVLLVDLLRGTTSRFTFGPARAYSSAWSPDGKRIIFVSQHNEYFGLYVKPTNGEKDEQLLLKSDQNMVATSWSHDGRSLLYESHDSKNYSDIWVLPLDGDKQPFPFLRTEFDEGQGYFSPDDRWVAYYSNESGRYEIYVRPFSGKPGDASGLGAKWLISTAGGVEPRWRADGKELFYVALDGKLMAAEVTSGPVFKASIPKALFQTPVAHREFGVVGTAEVSGDGKRFLFAVAAEPTPQAPFIVVQNWQAGMKK